MKKFFKVIFVLFFMLSFLSFFIDDKSDSKTSNTKTKVHKKRVNSKKVNLKFEQLGYFKSKNKLRYFVFRVNKTKQQLNKYSRTIKKHGASMMHTSGRVTASFYYGSDQPIPMITNLSAQEANDTAHAAKPAYAVWKLPTGKINLIQNPK